MDFGFNHFESNLMTQRIAKVVKHVSMGLDSGPRIEQDKSFGPLFNLDKSRICCDCQKELAGSDKNFLQHFNLIY